ncbi:UDP-galactose 4-epimerase [Nitrosococcus oceani ATCC 19707]|uniref:UDP-glucose 4-epimerase n=2 Tax=Nitrosococcus oceani TaxID=1229 RepID=Q3J8P9_NITOC|nr:UDP-glucose 4-epimerase GalE [Nitrosococcus oceani]ABA58797.1 UDP-galactose 4-epimerase [Nitrosococcus oceani ATCC 19707]EDZ68465.1 UDP-glucose 4-epimerase [Nitrosococcus oceani AFC27]KFI18605.1 UDP-glucose 4-epimerase [Nitrosococcus oceani C-27]GEM19113.1 UDP-glucose 4-epimerase GalE [Nitrosococcus oceani]
MAKKGILVTGGAGYIGSHVVQQLMATSHRVIVLDNLSTGFANAVPKANLVIGDTKDKVLVDTLLKEYSVDTVMHFAAYTIVPESVADPLKYYANNTCHTHNLLECCAAAGVKHFIFSSTAATYGIPSTPLVTEDTPTIPVNPYGTSKLMSEWMLRDLSQASSLNYVTLRYFNVAGSDPNGHIGQSTRKATLLIKVACEAAVGKREQVYIFGTDYPTPDGTGIRDYIHVEDLANAHILALDYLKQGGKSTTLNCGYGHGYSVREVLDAVQRVHGRPIKIVKHPRRPGDPPRLVAAAQQVRNVLGWQPKYDNLDFIVKTSLNWEYKLLARDRQSTINAKS